MARRQVPAILAVLALLLAAWLLLRGEEGSGEPSAGAGVAGVRDPLPSGTPQGTDSRRPPHSRAASSSSSATAPAISGAALRVMVREAATGEPVDTAAAGLHLEGAGRWSAFAHDDGSIRFDGLPAAAGTVSVNARGFLEAEAPVALVEGVEVVVEVELQSLPTIAGRVLSDATGKPVAGAEVRATDRPWAPGAFEGPPAATTGSDGGFSVRAGAPGGDVLVEVRAQGFLWRTEPLRLPTLGVEPLRPEIRLFAGGRLRGVVRDASGVPAPGAVVHVRSAGSGVPFRPRGAMVVLNSPLEGLLARAGEDGSFAVEGLAAGGLYRVAANTLVPPAWAVEERVLVPADGEDGFVDLRLAAGGQIVVTWKLPEGVVAAAPLHVRMWGLSGPAREFRMDERAPAGSPDDGMEESGLWHGGPIDVPPGTFTVSVSGKGLGGEERVTVLPGETVGVVLELESVADGEAAIEGTVVDDEGRPRAGATVSADLVDEVGAAERAVDATGGGVLVGVSGRGGRTDAEGRFHIRSLEKGKSYRVRVMGHLPFQEVEAPRSGILLTAPRTASLSGRAVIPAGASATGLLEYRTAIPAEDGRWRNYFGDLLGWKEGRFDVPGIRTGPVRLWLRRGTLVGGPVEATLAPGERRDLGDIPLRPGVPLSGRLVDGEGKGVAGASMALGTSWQSSGTCVTGADGSFDLGVRPPLPWPVEVTGDACVPTVLTVDPAAPAPLRLVVPRGGLLRGRVRDGAGLPAAGAMVEAAPAGGGAARRLVVDHLGRFEARLPAEVYQLMIQWEGAAIPAGGVRLAEGGTSELALSVR